MLYSACFLCASGVYILTGLHITWISSNVKGRYKRVVVISMNQTIGNAGGVVAGQIYIPSFQRRQSIPRRSVWCSRIRMRGRLGNSPMV